MNDDDILVINTESKSPTKVVEEQILPLPILTEGNPSLKIPVEEFDITQITQPEIQKFIKQLKLTMHTYSGVGLSANQCGFKFRMFVIGTDQFQMTCINPKIIVVGFIFIPKPRKFLILYFKTSITFFSLFVVFVLL